ncbi:kinetochore scaffold 1 [Calypte anna]|uniref:kinetochore scaffold 1 n=1 Tax=Calypte anna TaxID=9244 RepID=UPI0011C398F3|nr:kinetochore scaffold 1 [Calypte anna]
MGFEPTRAEHNGLAVHRLNHSATSSRQSCLSPAYQGLHDSASASFPPRPLRDGGNRSSLRGHHRAGTQQPCEPGGCLGSLIAASAAGAGLAGRAGGEGALRRSGCGLERLPVGRGLCFIGKADPSGMDKNNPDPNMENDNTEHIRGKRLSSILKAPRQPLDDLGSGNELTQDLNTEKRRKNSRRVSFADTINCRVFPRDLKNNVSERENTGKNTRNDVFHNQNEEPEAVPCEITGMNTLLHAPIQASVQQAEWHDEDTPTARPSRQDTTLVFSEGAEMEMTASHTAVISRNLRSSQADWTEKIDITSFLAALNPTSGQPAESKEFCFQSALSCPSPEQKEEGTAVKKIDFNEFLMSLKSQEKAPNAVEGPEKENVFLVPSQVLEDMALSSVEFVYPHQQLDTCNLTKVFRAPDDGMEMTKCQVPAAGQCLGAEVTQAFVDDGMEMTASHTAKLSCPFSSAGNQSLNFRKDFPLTDNSVFRAASNQHLIVQQDPLLCTDKRSEDVGDRGDLPVLRAVTQGPRTMSAIPGSISAETVFQGDKTLVFSKCEDMEMTGNYTDVIWDESSKEVNSSHRRTCEQAVSTNSSLAENRTPAPGGKEIAEILTPSGNGAPGACKNCGFQQASGEEGTQAEGISSANVGFDSGTTPVPAAVPRSQLQLSLPDSPGVSLPGEKTVMFSGEDMELTKTSSAVRPCFLDPRSAPLSLKEEEEMEMTQCHAAVIDDQSRGGTAAAKQMPWKIIPRTNQNRGVTEGTSSLDMEKENLEVISMDGNVRRSHAGENNTKGKPLNALVSCTSDKMGMFSGDQNMDLPEAHLAAFGVAPVHNRVQEYENNHNPRGVTSKQLPGVGVTSQPAATESGDVTLSMKQQPGHPLPPNGSFIPRNEPIPSGMKGKEQRGAMLGVNAGWQNSDKQEKAHTMRVVNKGLPTRVVSEREFSSGKMVQVDSNNPASADGPHSKGAGDPLLLSTSAAHRRSSQLPLFSEKSVFFPSGENMDLTGNCTQMGLDCNSSVGLSARAAGPAHLAQDENKTRALHRGVRMARSSQELPACDVRSFTRSGFTLVPFAGEKTTLFSEDADMDITRSHTVSADNRILLQCGSGSPFTPGDRTCVFTCSGDMEITRLDPVAIEEPMARAVPQGMLSVAKRTGRKSLKGEKTVLFSLSDENDEMEMTQSHTAAIGQEIVSQDEGGPHSVPSALPVTFSSGQAARGVPKPCSAAQGTVCCGDKSQEAAEQTLLESRAPAFALDGMELTQSHQGAWEGNSLQGRHPNPSAPGTSTILFTSYQADMEITQAHSERTERGFCEEGLQLGKQAGPQAAPGNRPIIFTSAEDMEVITAQTAARHGEMAVQDREPIPAMAAADKTMVFIPSQHDMEITASHTVPVSDKGFESQQVTRESPQQPGRLSATLPPCRDEAESLHAKELGSGCHTQPREKPSTPFPLSSAALPAEKGALQVPSATPPGAICSVSPPEEIMGVGAPQDPDLPTDLSGKTQQHLLPPENLTSKRVSLKLPSVGLLDGSEESVDLVSPLPIQQPNCVVGSPDAESNQRNHLLHEGSSGREALAADSGLAGASLAPVPNKEAKEKEGLPAGGEMPPKDFQMNSEPAEQLGVGDNPSEPPDPALQPELSGILNICSKLRNIRRRSAVFPVSDPAFSDQLPKSPAQPEDTLSLGENTGAEPTHLLHPKEQEDTGLGSGAAPRDPSSGIVLKDKYQGINVPLGIFQPKLPSRRNPSVSGVQDRNTKPSDQGEAAVSEGNTNAGDSPGDNKATRQHFSPSWFVAEDFLPICLEEMDSGESVSSELLENACTEIREKQIPHNEKNQFEETKTCSSTKRALEQDEEDLQSPKKPKSDENLEGEDSQDLQETSGAVSESQGEAAGGEAAKAPACPQPSTSSSLDSGKADTGFTTQPSSQVESQLLTDSICEDNLREKLESGVITVGEFFTLLEVHVPIQKPRRSHVPVTCAASTPPAPEDLLYTRYVYRPKLCIYEEDCQALAQKIDELKPYATVQDQLLVNVNRSFWEVMRTCSDEELKNFGAELNKMKSYFTKESKILAHNEKAELYSKLLQSAQEQHRKLLTRMEKLDGLLQEAESCFGPLEGDSGREGWEAEGSGGVAEGKSLKEELESFRAQEEKLQRELADLETENEQLLVQINLLKEKERSFQELLEKYDFTEWEVTEWNQQQAVFNFLYDSIELTVVFGPPVEGDVFGEDPSRKIVSLSFESLLDEEKAPPSSCLVQRLIFQFIDSQGCWQEKCPTLYHLPQVLQDVSLVVSHCRSLGEEIEFLERWGGTFNLLKTDISDTKVKLLFSASRAFAKFELTLSLSASYPSDPLPFSVRKQVGNIGEEEISALLSKVPAGDHYLQRIVSLIHQNLLQAPR